MDRDKKTEGLCWVGSAILILVAAANTTDAWLERSAMVAFVGQGAEVWEEARWRARHDPDAKRAYDARVRMVNDAFAYAEGRQRRLDRLSFGLAALGCVGALFARRLRSRRRNRA
jgi:hypothetical protein